MNLLETNAAVALGVALFAAVWMVRRSAAARRAPAAREVLDELRAPQIALGVYLLAWAWLFIHRASTHAFGDAQQLRASQFAVAALGGVALLRALDVALFGLLRAVRSEGPPKIVRSLLLWLLSVAIVAAAARKAWQFDLASLITTSALLSVVLGFALQESLGNLFAGLTLNAEHPFQAGDWVSFGKHTGRVLDVGWRSTRLVTQDEDELLVPNGFISREVVANHSRPSPRRTLEMQLTLDLAAAPDQARQTMLAAARGVEGVLALPAPVAQLERLSPDGAHWKLRISTSDFAHNDDLRDRVLQAVWYALRRAALELAVPQLSLARRERPEEAGARRLREHLAEAEELLGRIDFVTALRPQARAELARHARFVEYGPGEPVVRQGEPGDTFYLVAHGHLAVRASGREQEIARLSRGDFFGELALLTGEPRSASVIAVERAALLAIERDAFAQLFAADEAMMEQLAHVIAGRKAQLATALEKVSAETVHEEQSLLARIRRIFERRARGGVDSGPQQRQP